MRANRKTSQEQGDVMAPRSRVARKRKYRLLRRVLWLTVLAFLVLLGVVLGIHLHAHLQDQGVDHTIVALPTPIATINEGLPFALKRANTWRKDGVLTRVMVVFRGSDAVKSKKGDIYYTFNAVEQLFWNHRQVGCEVTVGMQEQALVNFRTFSLPDPRVPEELDIVGSSLDVGDLFALLANKVPPAVVNQYKSPMIIMNLGKKWSEILLCNLPGPDQSSSTTIIVNNEKKAVVTIKNNQPAVER